MDWKSVSGENIKLLLDLLADALVVVEVWKAQQAFWLWKTGRLKIMKLKSFGLHQINSFFKQSHERMQYRIYLSFEVDSCLSAK